MTNDESLRDLLLFVIRSLILPSSLGISSFRLNTIVPSGRFFQEYQRMFALMAADPQGTILACADGPANFNAEAMKQDSLNPSKSDERFDGKRVTFLSGLIRACPASEANIATTNRRPPCVQMRWFAVKGYFFSCFLSLSWLLFREWLRSCKQCTSV